MPLHFQNGKAVEKLVPASTKTVKVMGPQAVPEATLHEVLAHLAALGVFQRLPAPAGALAADLWQALAHLGDASWLAGHAGFDRDTQANAQRWVERYGRGLAVPSRNDVPS
ncbi:hypothetical protein RD110_19890 [Rhodoferax koreense]|uniref:Uncharacterized protein n=1 Tax=Rhodoferax koreensis TaxID=1842727 RepID=A0A1P8JZM2_9BURK|nr:hypothetical protein [Rhodoferax koreense]APW39196.1 hypothetical protein RD110_19890 [Rhodoferax koreense]